MPSQAFTSLSQALIEIGDLQSANPSPTGAAPGDPAITRVIGRASVVLLSSHFERYIYAVNEEAVSFINDHKVAGDSLPLLIRLQHTQGAIDTLAKTKWDRRTSKLTALVQTDAWLWGGPGQAALTHQRLLSWMKSPKPESILRYFRYWGIENVFVECATGTFPEWHLRLKLAELVDKRNAIAHGDLTTEATQADVSEYIDVVQTFCSQADSWFSQHLTTSLSISAPW